MLCYNMGTSIYHYTIHSWNITSLVKRFTESSMSHISWLRLKYVYHVYSLLRPKTGPVSIAKSTLIPGRCGSFAQSYLEVVLLLVSLHFLAPVLAVCWVFLEHHSLQAARTTYRAHGNTDFHGISPVGLGNNSTCIYDIRPKNLTVLYYTIHSLLIC